MTDRRITGMTQTGPAGTHYEGDGCVPPHGTGLRQRPGDQPLPAAGRGPLSHDLVIGSFRRSYSGSAMLETVCAEVEERRQLGISRYGRPLQAHNGRDALLDMYQELLDGLAYGATAITEGTPRGVDPALLQHAYVLLEGAAWAVRHVMFQRDGR